MPWKQVRKERLPHEVRQGPAVVQAHARAVGVEDTHDPRLELVVPVVGHGDGLGKALGLVVHRAGPDGVDVPPVGLLLRVHLRVAVDFGG